MCTPAAAIFTSVLATGVSVYSSMEQGRYNAQVAENNAITAEYQAADTLERGQLAEKQSRLKTKNLIGQQKAAVAGSGFSLDEDTSVGDLLADTAMLGEEDVYEIRSNAAREAWSYRVSANNSRAQGQLAQSSGTSDALGSILGGASSVSETWLKYKK